MRSCHRAIATGLFLLLLPGLAGAQDQGDAGITLGHPGTIGVLWHVSDRVAVRPEFGFSYTSSESTIGDEIAATSTGWTLVPGISAVVYLQRYERLRTYFSPRFTFARSTNSFEADPSAPTAKSTNKSYSGVASFGTHYSFTEKLSLFAELGLGVTRTTGSSALSPAKTGAYQWATRTGVGVVFYF